MKDSLNHSRDSTSTNLVARIRAKEDEAWNDFVDLYGPLIYSWLRKNGLAVHDAQDQLQNVFRRVADNIDSFQHGEATNTFRGWLFTITKRLLIDLSRKNQEKAAGGTDAFQWIEQVADPYSGDSTLSLVVGGDGVAHRALAKVSSEFSDKAIEAFRFTAVDGLNASEAAEKLQMSPAAVRKAKSRILQRLRELLGETN